MSIENNISLENNDKKQLDVKSSITEMISDKVLTKTEREALEEMYLNLDNIPKEANADLQKFLLSSSGSPDFEIFKGKLLAKMLFKEKGEVNIPEIGINVKYEDGVYIMDSLKEKISFKPLERDIIELNIGNDSYVGKFSNGLFYYTSKNGEKVMGVYPEQLGKNSNTKIGYKK